MNSDEVSKLFFSLVCVFVCVSTMGMLFIAALLFRVWLAVAVGYSLGSASGQDPGPRALHHWGHGCNKHTDPKNTVLPLAQRRSTKLWFDSTSHKIFPFALANGLAFLWNAVKPHSLLWSRAAPYAATLEALSLLLSSSQIHLLTWYLSNQNNLALVSVQ